MGQIDYRYRTAVAEDQMVHLPRSGGDALARPQCPDPEQANHRFIPVPLGLIVQRQEPQTSLS